MKALDLIEVVNKYVADFGNGDVGFSLRYKSNKIYNELATLNFIDAVRDEMMFGISPQTPNITFYLENKSDKVTVETVSVIDGSYKQNAIDFLKWAVEEHSVPYEGFSLSGNRLLGGDTKFVNGEELTMAQFYELYLQSKGQVV